MQYMEHLLHAIHGALIACNTWSTDCMQYMEHLLRVIHGALIACNMSWATWYEGKVQLLSLTEFKSHLVSLYFIG